MRININLKSGAVVLGGVFLILGAVNSTLGNVSGGATCLAAGFLVILLFHFDVKKFNVFGLAAELREKISEADRILEKLRGISLPVSEIAIASATQMRSRANPLSRKQLNDYVSTISSELKSMDLSEQQIDNIKSFWVKSTTLEMVSCIQRKISVFIENKKLPLYKLASGDMTYFVTIDGKRVNGFDYWQQIQQEEFKLGESLFSSEKLNDNYYETIQGFINNSIVFSAQERKSFGDDLEEELIDLKYFTENKTLRRPEIWFSGDSHLFAS